MSVCKNPHILSINRKFSHVKCSACPPEVEHQVVVQCPYCSQLLCEQHLPIKAHQCSALLQNNPLFPLETVFRQAVATQPAKRKLSSAEVKKRYEYALKQSSDIIMVGNEAIDLFIGGLLILFALSGFETWGEVLRGNYDGLVEVMINFIILMPAFILHELAHKFVAQRKQLFARYVLHAKGIMFTLITTLIRFGIVAPGFVAIIGQVDKRGNGHISIVGPLTNLLLGSIGLLLASMTQLLGINTPLLLLFYYKMAFFNSFLALFNLIPVWNLDGAKVLRWNPLMWLSVSGVSFGMFLYSLGFLFPSM